MVDRPRATWSVWHAVGAARGPASTDMHVRSRLRETRCPLPPSSAGPIVRKRLSWGRTRGSRRYGSLGAGPSGGLTDQQREGGG